MVVSGGVRGERGEVIPSARISVCPSTAGRGHARLLYLDGLLLS